MAGIRPVQEKGPLTFLATTLANGGLIKGGQLVEPDAATGKIKVAGVASAAVLGVATGDASPSDHTNANTTDDWGNPVVNAQYPPNEVAVAYQGVWRLTAAGAINFGDFVVAAANGAVAAVAAAGATYAAAEINNTRSIVGRCVEPGGIAAGATGKILLGGVGA